MKKPGFSAKMLPPLGCPSDLAVVDCLARLPRSSGGNREACFVLAKAGIAHGNIRAFRASESTPTL
jgi:hypothetical protein